MNMFDRILKIFGLVRQSRYDKLGVYAWDMYDCAIQLHDEFDEYKSCMEEYSRPVKQPPQLEIIKGGKDV